MKKADSEKQVPMKIPSKKIKTCSRTARERKMISEEISALTNRINKISGSADNTANGRVNGSEDNASLLSDDGALAHKMNVQLANWNNAFLDELEKLTIQNGVFKLKRLNEGVKANTFHFFAVPVRNYAQNLMKFYDFDNGSFWSKLSKKDKEFSKIETITREEVIALAFVFRLTSNQLNSLLKSLGYYGLYPRNIIDAALFFVLDTYQSSMEFERFKDPQIKLSKEEFVSNYAFFYRLVEKQSKIDLSLMQSEYIMDFRNRLTSITINGKQQPSLDTNKWILSQEMLCDFIESSTACENNNTLQCQKELKRIIDEVNDSGQYGNDAKFTEYLNSGSAEDGSNRERFVANREKSHRYLIKMLYRFFLREKREAHSEFKNGIKISQFFKLFTVFLNNMNIDKASELFITEYLFIEEDRVKARINKFCIDFFHKDLNCYTKEQQKLIKKLFCLYVRSALNIKEDDSEKECEKFCVDFFHKELNCYTKEQQKLIKKLFHLYVKSTLNIKKDDPEKEFENPVADPVVFSECEIDACKRILITDNTITANHYASFRKILLAETDISRLLFILLYLFTYAGKNEKVISFDDALFISADSEFTDKNGINYYVTTRGSMDELNRWLLDSGFMVLSPKEYLYYVVEKYMKYFNNSDDSAIYLSNILKNVLLHDGSLQILSKLHMSSYSLYTMEMVLLPKQKQVN